MFKENAPCGGAVGIPRANKPTNQGQKSLELRFRVVEAPCARPSVRTPENCLVAISRNHPFKRLLNEVECCLPGHRNETILVASFARAVGTAAQPALAHRRLQYATTMMHGVWNRANNIGGI